MYLAVVALIEENIAEFNAIKSQMTEVRFFKLNIELLNIVEKILKEVRELNVTSMNLDRPDDREETDAEVHCSNLILNSYLNNISMNFKEIFYHRYCAGNQINKTRTEIKLHHD